MVIHRSVELQAAVQTSLLHLLKVSWVTLSSTGRNGALLGHCAQQFL